MRMLFGRPGRVSIETGIWYYFTVDLDLEGFASFEFVRYVDVNGDRKAAIVQLLDRDYFGTKQLILLPYNRKRNYFNAKPDGMLSVWAFDASDYMDVDTIDLKSGWPRNILDKAAITPSKETAVEWTKGT